MPLDNPVSPIRPDAGTGAAEATNANLLSSIITIGLPEELAKAIPVLVIAAFFRRRLSPVDYLFLGAVSGLVFGASEVERYITGVVQSTGSGSITDGDAGILILAYVWRFITDPISHACWAGLTGYFIGLAVRGHPSRGGTGLPRAAEPVSLIRPKTRRCAVPSVEPTHNPLSVTEAP